MIVCGIYKIQSKIKPDRVYIGSSINMQLRWLCHLRELRANKHQNKLQRHFNKYGESDLNFDVVITCEKNELVEKEQFFIDAYKPWFNISPTAGNCLGVKHTDQSRRNMSLAHIGQIPANKGIPKTEEEKERNRIWHLGRKMSEETKQKISVKNKGRICSEEHRRNIAISKIGNKNAVGNTNMLGKKQSEETINKRIAKIKGRKQSKEWVRKRVEKFKGIKRSPEVCKKLSDIRKEWWNRKNILKVA